MGAGLSVADAGPYVTAIVIGICSAWYIRTLQTPKIQKRTHKNAPEYDKSDLKANEHTVMRKAMLAYAKATDHAGDVVIVPDPNFDLNKTIFQTVEGAPARYIISSKTGVEMFWSDKAADEYTVKAATLPRTPNHDKALIQFMLNECDFFVEHADGTFMDHLQFCYDYGVHYFQGHSPRVLLLHSILGVATNIFPMDVSKESKLRTFLNDAEMRQIEAFPSVLRCLLNWDLTMDLTKLDKSKMAKLKSFTYHRCIDNKKVVMDIDDFWVQLNYQLIHLLDFLPVSCWKAHMNDQLFLVFIKLHEFLKAHGKLMAKVDLDLSEASPGLAGQPMTLADMIRRSLPNAIVKKMHVNSIRKFSAKIGHSLEYKLV